ncbi:hypothetical protein KCU59_g16, partial [Aureobasidium melanogenum]
LEGARSTTSAIGAERGLEMTGASGLLGASCTSNSSENLTPFFADASGLTASLPFEIAGLTFSSEAPSSPRTTSRRSPSGSYTGSTSSRFVPASAISRCHNLRQSSHRHLRSLTGFRPDLVRPPLGQPHLGDSSSGITAWVPIISSSSSNSMTRSPLANEPLNKAGFTPDDLLALALSAREGISFS